MTNLTALIEELEDARNGSRILDGKIEELVNPNSKPSIDRGWFIYSDNSALYRCPDYTTILDAKLPGEDIEHVERRSDGSWLAIDARASHQDVVGRTEPLARRIAALKAMEDGK